MSCHFWNTWIDLYQYISNVQNKVRFSTLNTCPLYCWFLSYKFQCVCCVPDNVPFNMSHLIFIGILSLSLFRNLKKNTCIYILKWLENVPIRQLWTYRWSINYYNMCTLQDMDLNQGLNQSVTDVQTRVTLYVTSTFMTGHKNAQHWYQS